MSDLDEDQQFVEDLRRRTRLATAMIVSIGAAISLSGLGALTESRSVVVLAGLAGLSTSFAMYRLHGDGYVAPSATISGLGFTREDRQAGAPLIFLLWALGAFAVAYNMK